ncbi:hypothetical protein ACHHYP_20618 [Achlya hypogyna]|uniref:Secreted protein n=1 Tax=Achlya hypogyna TaxID=1202772 RepID=A0A1V9YH18_ACHHY|nr:hypothetical protein ACHHYP_20618 [Achlya hypogyna]
MRRVALVAVVVAAVGAMVVEMGVRYGLEEANANVPMEPDALRHILAGVQQEKSDSLYLFGLMHYYGHGVATDHDAALRFIRQAARLRHIDAQFTLGMLHYEGLGVAVVPQADTLAYAYLQPAAMAGHADAQWMLGTLLNHGRGVPPNPSRAAELFTASTQQGNPRGAFHLGTLHEYGRAVPKNLTLAASLYQSAASHDVPEAFLYLGLMHTYGRGMPRDYDHALGLFHKVQSFAGPLTVFQGAALGSAGAKYYLGVLHVSGLGLAAVDYDQGLRWFEAAALANDPSVSPKALAAATQLKRLLEQANARKTDAIARYVVTRDAR